MCGSERKRQEEQRLDRVGAAAVEPERGQAQPVPEVAQSLAEEEPEDDRPDGACDENAREVAHRRRPGAEAPADEQRCGEQERPVGDVPDHRADHQRQDERHQQGGIERSAARQVEEAHEELERPRERVGCAGARAARGPAESAARRG